MRLQPIIRLAAGEEDPAVVEARVQRALLSARKYRLVANSIKSALLVESEIHIEKKKENVPC